MERSLDILVVNGFAVRKGRDKWACCYEIRLAIIGGPLLYRGELHGRRFVSEAAAVVAAQEIGQQEAARHLAAAQRMVVALRHPSLP